jgi:hypothetical protein
MRPENYVEVGLPAASSRKISIDQVSREDKYSLSVDVVIPFDVTLIGGNE